nr:prophage tail fiber N-terminal domain-containing protein [Escherichia coli]
MSVQISGVLKDGTGKPVPDCTIELKATRTSETVIVTTVAECQPGKQAVTPCRLSRGVIV